MGWGRLREPPVTDPSLVQGGESGARYPAYGLLIVVPGQPALRAHSGRFDLVVSRRVICSGAVEFCEWAAPLVSPVWHTTIESVNRPRASGSGNGQAHRCCCDGAVLAAPTACRSCRETWPRIPAVRDPAAA